LLRAAAKASADMLRARMANESKSMKTKPAG
jgi:hypothetical protein